MLNMCQSGAYGDANSGQRGPNEHLCKWNHVTLVLFSCTQ